ncbi:MAG TPA: CHAP domain-containing protein [Verrucomicrobiae bacterium]|nr:CHAP domain-containing protein [Verrucomicrobiae bacterium]
MKMSTTTPFKKFVSRARYYALALLMAVSLPASFGALPVSANAADRIRDQIEAAEREVKQFEAQIERLQGQANTLQNALAKLAAEKAAIQAKVDANEAKRSGLITEIAETEANIKRNQAVLGETVASLYLDDGLSPLEMLASSKSIGDYIDKQEYRTAIREQLQVSINEIKELRRKLNEQKVAVEKILAEQKGQRDQIAAKEAERQRLLRETRGQEANYSRMAGERRREINQMAQELNALYAQAAARWRGGYITVGGGGGYKYAGQGLTIGNCPGDCVDEFRLYRGQCTSYVAWRLASEGYKVYTFDGRGDATQWPDTATSYWASLYGEVNAAKVRNYPRAGFAAVDQNIAPPYGHVMYVEAVNGDGTITIAEYNYQSPDTFSKRKISPAGLVFLEFARQ